MPEGLVAERRSAAAGACPRVRLWPLPVSAQLLRRVVSDVLGAEPAGSLPLVVASAADGARSLRVAAPGTDVHLEVPLSDLVIGAPDGVAGDEPGTCSRGCARRPRRPAARESAGRLGRDRLRRGVDVPDGGACPIGGGALRPVGAAACGHPFRRGPAGLRRSRRRPRRAVLTRRSFLSIRVVRAGADVVPASVCLRLTWCRPRRRAAPEGS